MAKNWVAGATKNKGALHRNLGIPEGQKIPAKTLSKAAGSSNPTIAKEVSLAKTLKGMHHPKQKTQKVNTGRGGFGIKG